MRQTIEGAVNKDRFSIIPVFNKIFDTEEYAEYGAIYQQVVEATSQAVAKKVLKAILRFAFFIEPVKTPAIETTKFASRWSDRLHVSDPRKTTFEDCVAIFNELLQELEQALISAEKTQLLTDIVSHALVSYEINIDYKARLFDGPMHRADNICFYWGELPKTIVRLRSYLLNPANHHQIEFFVATYSKLIVKTYLTDRVLTGTHKTNREKRWECHPASVHFALRKDGMGIEEKLIEQICYFDGFPTEIREQLIELGIFEAEDQVTRCPITLDPISFEYFRQEVLSPTHGKASFQVGHIHPLKAIADNPYTGHTPENISWISSQGNRIQGEFSVEETRQLIFRIIKNYKDAGLVD